MILLAFAIWCSVHIVKDKNLDILAKYSPIILHINVISYQYDIAWRSLSSILVLKFKQRIRNFNDNWIKWSRQNRIQISNCLQQNNYLNMSRIINTVVLELPCTIRIKCIYIYQHIHMNKYTFTHMNMHAYIHTQR